MVFDANATAFLFRLRTKVDIPGFHESFFCEDIDH